MNGAQLFEQMNRLISRLNSEISQLNQQISSGLTQVDSKSTELAIDYLRQLLSSSQPLPVALSYMSEALKLRQKEIAINLQSIEKLQEQHKQADALNSNLKKTYQSTRDQADQAKQSILTTFWASAENASIKNRLTEKENIFNAATARARKAKEEESTKASTYTNDPIFNYLHQRQFGTALYKARGFIRNMDSWIAAISHYQEASRHFEILTQLPLYLQKHVNNISDELNQLRNHQSSMERSALDQARFDNQEIDVQNAKTEADKVSTSLVKIQNQLHEHIELAQQYDQFQDPAARIALEPLINQIKNNPPQEIRQAQETINAIVQERNKKTATRDQLQQAQMRFTNAGYNSPATIYRGNTDPSAILTGFLLGQLTFDALENSMLRQSSYSWDPAGNDSGGDFDNSSGWSGDSGGGFDGGDGFGSDSGGGGFDNSTGF
jgi:uncharacterized membrane protein YgcG